jgi:hypothetical protein
MNENNKQESNEYKIHKSFFLCFMLSVDQIFELSMINSCFSAGKNCNYYNCTFINISFPTNF